MFDETDEERVAITFRLPAALGASTGAVVGEFNEWDATSDLMDRGADGSLSAVVDIAIGHTYRYRYLVDGDRWENDWNADAYSPNAFGGDDSVLDLTEGSSRLRERERMSARPDSIQEGAAASGSGANQGEGQVGDRGSAADRSANDV